MEVYRLAHRDFAGIDGKGGLYHSGRWHSKGALVVYTASSKALALLERLVHENASQIPPFTLLTLWVPDDAPATVLSPRELPTGWDTLPDTDVVRRIGDAWLADRQHGFLRVPSAIVPDEFNLLMNPVHPEVSRVKIVDSRPFHYDRRLLDRP